MRFRCRSFCIVFLPSMQESESESSLHRNISSASAHSLVLTALSVGLQPRCEGHAVFTAAELSFLSGESMSWTTNSLRVVLCSNTSHSFLRPAPPFENKPFECLSFSFFQIVILFFFICSFLVSQLSSFICTTNSSPLYCADSSGPVIISRQGDADCTHMPGFLGNQVQIHVCVTVWCAQDRIWVIWFFFLPHLHCTFWPTFKPSLGSYRLSSKSLDIRCHASLLHWCNAGVDWKEKSQSLTFH